VHAGGARLVIPVDCAQHDGEIRYPVENGFFFITSSIVTLIDEAFFKKINRSQVPSVKVKAFYQK